MAFERPVGPAAAALLWVAADCALAWSWTVFPGGPDRARAWFGCALATTALLNWVVLGAWSGRWRLCVGAFALSVLPAWGAVAHVDWASFSLPAADRPGIAWGLANVAVGAAFALAATTPREPRWWRSGAILAFGAAYSWLYPVHVFTCGYGSGTDWLCHGLLGSNLRALLTAFGAATLAVAAVAVSRRFREG